MPPQQAHRLLDLVDDRLGLGTHGNGVLLKTGRPPEGGPAGEI
jgi:hypothetical protein